MAKKQNILPSVLAFRRGVVITDGGMFNVMPDGTTPIKVVRHGILGTQNTAKEASGKSTTKVANLQETDTAKLDIGAEQMRVCMTLRFMPLRSLLDSCCDAAFPVRTSDLRSGLSKFIELTDNSKGLLEVAHRYIRNVVNGRWLWRNRSEAATVAILIEADGKQYKFDALSYSLNSFDGYCAKEDELAAIVAKCLSSEKPVNIAFKVEADISFGTAGGNEVYPSQNYVNGKPSGFARSLYCYGNAERASSVDGSRVMGFAALRDQKIGNALRTFDTWYPKENFLKDTGVSAENAGPIAVEPNGANLDFMKVFRIKEHSAFTILGHIGEVDPNTEEGMFMIACLIRGGVYGNDEKDKAKTDTDATGE
ncbi:MAG: type I-F CRISPR-associated protein Csy3 [Gallionella sp.]|nr:type I-F CRISPR-associated protein Csy3 [Gallionella sp.]